MIASAKMAHAKTPKLIMWDDLIPPGVPYAEIIAEGEIDEVNDFWNPVYDEQCDQIERRAGRGLYSDARLYHSI